MPTKYDVFAELIEHAPIAAKDLPFKTRVYAHLKALVDDGLAKKQGTQYVPVKTEKTLHMFRIIRYCIKNGLDYNQFLVTKNAETISVLFDSAPVLRPTTLRNNSDVATFINYLENHQFVLLTKLRPRQGLILEHQLLDETMHLFENIKKKPQTQYIPVQNELTKITSEPINPFDDDTFAFLAGSAQLEGSTVTIGETREIILQDIYPDKPKKDIQMVKNLNEALHYIIEHLTESITPEHIQELNKAVLFSLHRNAGKYKKTQNKIQGNPSFKTAKPYEIAQRMIEYCEFLNTVHDNNDCLNQLGKIHNDLQHIHPFSDGNSRTTRMIVNWMLLKHQIPLLVLKMGCFDAYMNQTKLAKIRNDEQLKLLLHQVLYHEQLR
jgi:fido (protein-threonine AMPylation protein)